MPTVIITCFDILYTIYLRLCLKKRPPHNKKRFRIQKSPGGARDVITTTITRHAGALKIYNIIFLQKTMLQQRQQLLLLFSMILLFIENCLAYAINLPKRLAIASTSSRGNWVPCTTKSILAPANIRFWAILILFL